MALIVYQVDVGGFDHNFSYVIADTVTRESYVVDPSGDFLKVSIIIDAHQYHVAGVLLTHTHADHLDQLSAAVAQYHAPIYVHELGVMEIAKYEDVRTLRDGIVLPLGAGHITVLHTPGHTDDSVCFYIPAAEADDATPQLLTGDTLFVEGCGRTNELRVKDLYESLVELAALPKETIVFPGHNYGSTPTSTIGHEKMYNKYYQVGNYNDFKRLRLG